MKTVEKPKRRFLSTVHSASMEETAKGCFVAILEKDYSIEDLKGMKFISALTNKPLVDYLKKNGIEDAEVSPNTKIYLQAGDELFVINPNIRLHDLKPNEELPPHTTIQVRRKIVFKNQSMMDTILNNL